MESLLALLASLEPGSTELGFHPGKGALTGSSYAMQRSLELATLCDPRVRGAIDELGIELIGFSSLALKR